MARKACHGKLAMMIKEIYDENESLIYLRKTDSRHHYAYVDYTTLSRYKETILLKNSFVVCYNKVMRLDRYIANSGYGTRSDVRSLIRSGRVSVDGRSIQDPSFSGFSERDSRVAIDGQPILFSRFLYLALYKPDEYLTAMEDKRLKTIADLLPTDLLGKGISPVGRLDYHTTGLLLITNNGTLSHRLTSPKWHAEKIYRVTYEGNALTESEQELFAKGMTLTENGREPERLAPAKLEPISDSSCILTLTEGKSHQVKRMMAQIERPVLTLHRESVGGIRLHPSQKPGDVRLLDKSEIDQLFALTKMDESQC